MKRNCYFVILFVMVTCCRCQQEPEISLAANSLKHISRVFIRPAGRAPTVDDIMMRYYKTNFSSPKSYKIGATAKLLANPNLDFKKPTVIYTHGFIEFSTDESVATVVSAYLTRGGYNVLMLDWSNLAFGDILTVARNVPLVGRRAGKAILKLLMGGVALDSVHLVGHSMGAHVMGSAAGHLNARGYKVPRLTGLDPASIGFYQFLLPPVAQPLGRSAAVFVDVIHTDSGWFGAPAAAGHADFWPNGGRGPQPGCLASLPLTGENFCSHRRSWAFWAESVVGGEFRARPCRDYDTFLRGQCTEDLVYMGLQATIKSLPAKVTRAVTAVGSGESVDQVGMLNVKSWFVSEK